ncbi:hypothetical protein [Allorhizobium ampelinum]|uniref:hypothetical protein n=1 Tax=Allorhizobium ampelinum TaxID=3025782 RepID=UPI001F3A7FBD|nr:hypothetical protein [Allorhizobium ampelinum]
MSAEPAMLAMTSGRVSSQQEWLEYHAARHADRAPLCALSQVFGTAFSRLGCASDLKPILDQVMRAEDWKAREAGLIEACGFAAELQIAKGVPGASAPAIVSINARPYQFMDSLAIFASLRSSIEDEKLRQLPEFRAADQFLTSNFVLAVPAYASAATTSLLELAKGTESE